MDLINSFLNFIFNILFFPFKSIDPVWGMLVFSFLTGIIMLFVFKATSDQTGIKKAKNLVTGHFLAIRLYRDDISLMLDTMKNIFLSILFYMIKSLRPMLFLIVPVGIVLIQLGIRYEYRPLNVGETTVVSLRLNDHAESVVLNEVELDLPDGLSMEIPPVRIQQLDEINWRIKAEKPGIYNLVFRYNDKTLNKRLQVVESLVPISTQIASDNFITALLNPGESSLPNASAATSISVMYPKRDFKFLGITLHWLVAFFVFSLIFGFSLKRFVGVEL
ncbi:MAG: hypothetical protein ACE5JB_04160 [bacterium]